MPKYRVEISQTTDHVIYVTADNEDAVKQWFKDVEKHKFDEIMDHSEGTDFTLRGVRETTGRGARRPSYALVVNADGRELR